MTNRSNWKGACAMFLFCVTTVLASPAQVFKTVLSFDGTNGAYPYYSSLVQGTDGNLYGTTNGIGLPASGGTLFNITTQGELQTIYTFCPPQNCVAGAYPMAGVIQGLDGDFYGTTSDGGANDYYGTIFRVASAGVAPLYSFGPSSGSNPRDGLVQGFDGNFYGTTYGGGGSPNCLGGCGTIFKITVDGSLTTLHSFEGTTDASFPIAGLTQAADGAFYGTTYVGAFGNPCCGTIFRITPAGVFTTIYEFQGNGDASNPESALIQASDGLLYGTTPFGGAHDAGAIFRVSLSGKYQTIYSFCPQAIGCAIGEGPLGKLVQGSDGNFYGTTTGGGHNREGTIFELTKEGHVVALHSFCAEPNCADGENPMAGLIQATNGTFYGTTENGGSSAYYGTIFSLSNGLSPFVAFVQGAGKIGQDIGILGQGFTETTSVSFNGIIAENFSINSDTFLTATIPAGATTGYVTVASPTSTLTSNVPFYVIP